ncbi:hypothetical protein [Paenibacillus antarcticus]|uniref:Uncharacterized protein n=1 Tax=Paenibacillus antarcticus TaxID=253703 RepID=A0A168PZ16_9BACL|nr:hypothetical protein [Paenibacillus antarcticus]OAB47208.1 hypothetical protein PBAT_07995 [Paenibacillus antarcticus]
MGVIIVIVSLTGCTSLQDNNKGSDLNTYEGTLTRVKVTKEELIDTTHIEKGNSEEIIVEKVPSQLKGYIEDEVLKVSILAEIDADKMNYKTNNVFSNKTDKSLDLVFDDNITKDLQIQLQTEEARNMVTRSVKASDFVLEVTTPTVIKYGGTLQVKGVLKYIGNETIKFSHGGPIIRFSFTGSNESCAYKDIGYVTELVPGQMFEVVDEFKVIKTGKQKLTVRTTTLDVNDALIEGVGNETYLTEKMVGRNLEFEKSRLSMFPIEIRVN